MQLPESRGEQRADTHFTSSAPCLLMHQQKPQGARGRHDISNRDSCSPVRLPHGRVSPSHSAHLLVLLTSIPSAVVQRLLGRQVLEHFTGFTVQGKRRKQWVNACGKGDAMAHGKEWVSNTAAQRITERLRQEESPTSPVFRKTLCNYQVGIWAGHQTCFVLSEVSGDL